MYLKFFLVVALFACSQCMTVEEAQKNPLQGYVLTDDDGQVVPISGVRIGPLDLSYTTPQMLQRIGIQQDLIQKFQPYMDVRGEEAKQLLEQQPLKLTQEEFDRISEKAINFLDDHFERLPGPLRQHPRIMEIRQLAEQKQWPQFLVELSQILQRFNIRS